MNISTATFKTSAAEYTQCPKPDLPEYAFIGRSNVGKSSLINMLTQRNGLAKTSQTPGKTQLINHFMINDSWYLVDLPGYGWAKTGRDKRDSWGKMTKDYLTKRDNLQCIFVLIDSRLEPQKVDLEFMEWLGVSEIPFVMIFTKADKQSPTRTQKNIEVYTKTMLETWEETPKYFVSSSSDKTGREEILAFIDSLNKQYKASKQ